MVEPENEPAEIVEIEALVGIMDLACKLGAVFDLQADPLLEEVMK